MTTKFILISGKAGAGKDTLGKYIQDQLREREMFAIVDAFASPMKRFLADMVSSYDIEANEKIWGSSERRSELIPGTKTSYREALQWLGTEWGRRVDPHFWARYAFGLDHREDLDNDGLPYTPDVVIFTDARFPEEIAYARDNKLPHVCINIIDVSTAPDERETQPEWRKHISETGISNIPKDWFDVTIYNNKKSFECFEIAFSLAVYGLKL